MFCFMSVHDLELVPGQWHPVLHSRYSAAPHIFQVSLQSQYQHALLTYSLTSCSRALLENVTGSQLARKFPAFYGTPRFITAFTTALHLSLSWARSIQSIPPHPNTWRSILVLTSHLSLGLPSGLIPTGFPTKTLYKPLLSPYVLHAPAITSITDNKIFSVRHTWRWWKTRCGMQLCYIIN
jgi:hypothetical protein